MKEGAGVKNARRSTRGCRVHPFLWPLRFRVSGFGFRSRLLCSCFCLSTDRVLQPVSPRPPQRWAAIMRPQSCAMLSSETRGPRIPRHGRIRSTCLGKGADFAFLATLQLRRLVLSTFGFRLSSFTGGTGFQPVIHMYRQDACTPSVRVKSGWTVNRSSRRSLKAAVSPRPPVNPKPDFSVPSNLCDYTTILSPKTEISTASESGVRPPRHQPITQGLLPTRYTWYSHHLNHGWGER